MLQFIDPSMRREEFEDNMSYSALATSPVAEILVQANKYPINLTCLFPVYGQVQFIMDFIFIQFSYHGYTLVSRASILATLLNLSVNLLLFDTFDFMVLFPLKK